jgi:hypothetical protein
MRGFPVLSAAVVLAGLVGCGKSGPTQPASVTAEMEQQMKDEQKAVDAEEKQQMAVQKKNKPLSPEQQVEMEERARQRGR